MSQRKTKPDTNVCHEIEIHYKRPILNIAKRIKSSYHTERIIREYINANRIDYTESFVALFLSHSLQPLYISTIASGAHNFVNVEIKLILQLAIKTHTSYVIVAHNHPSGTLRPSMSDIEITKLIKNKLDYFNIKLIDHIIVTSESYISFADDGITPF